MHACMRARACVCPSLSHPSLLPILQEAFLYQRKGRAVRTDGWGCKDGRGCCQHEPGFLYPERCRYCCAPGLSRSRRRRCELTDERVGMPVWVCVTAAVIAVLLCGIFFLRFLRRRGGTGQTEQQALQALYPPSVSPEGDLLHPVFQYDGRPLYPVACATGRPGCRPTSPLPPTGSRCGRRPWSQSRTRTNPKPNTNTSGRASLLSRLRRRRRRRARSRRPRLTLLPRRRRCKTCDRGWLFSALSPTLSPVCQKAGHQRVRQILRPSTSTALQTAPCKLHRKGERKG